MFAASPFYRSYNSYSSFYQPQPQSVSNYSDNQRYADLERARALATQRARRAQWLPDEYEGEDEYDLYQLSPHGRAYLDARRNHARLERERQQREQEVAEGRIRELEEQQWQQELNRRQKGDEEVHRRMEEERERQRKFQVQGFHFTFPTVTDIPQQQQQMHEDGALSPKRSIPISTPDGRIPSPRPSEAPTQRPVSPAQEPPRQPAFPALEQYSEKHVEAASTLQRCFRIHKSIRRIQSLSSGFDTLRCNFTYPSIISLQKPNLPPTTSDVIDVTAVSPSTLATPNIDDSLDMYARVSVPKLAFNSTNYTLLAYREALDELLVKLDGVESWGSPGVRTKRRAVVRQIEEEQAFVDRFCRTSWLRHLKEQGESVDGDLPAEIDTDMPAMEEAKL
jgi:hypothetical protein